MEIFNWTPINGATERSEGAPPATERSEGAPPTTERSEGASPQRPNEVREHPPMTDRKLKGHLMDWL